MPKNTQDRRQMPRLLLIDDEEGFVNVMAKRMEKRGFNVTKALSGSQSLQLLRKTDYNLVVLDLKIEDMDGIEILKILKKMAPEIPVIMLSGHGSEEEAKKGILAVGTDLFHIFAKAIMGSVIHRKLGNVSVALAFVFLIGAIIGATVGGVINRVLYEINPVLSDAFITTIYSLMLGLLGTYAMTDFLKAKKAGKDRAPHGQETGGKKDEGVEMGNLPKKLQSVKMPPMIKFDFDIAPSGRSISWVFLVLSGALVGLAAGIMGVGGGFLTFPIFVYMLGVSSMTTVGTDIFQIVFTAGYASISQYAVYGFIFYTLAMGMLLGSLLGIQIGALVTKVVQGVTIRGFYAMAVLAGFANRIFALPSKLSSLGVLPISKSLGSALESFGIWAFFIVIAGFSIWVIGTFLKNIGVLKGEEAK